VQLHKYKAFHPCRTGANGGLNPWNHAVFEPMLENRGWHIDCLIASQSMTTAVLRIAKASVGEGTGIKRPHRGASKQSSGPFPTKARASLFLIERDRVTGRAGADLFNFAEDGIRHAREGGLAHFYIGAAVVAGAGSNRFCEQGEL